MSLTLHASNDYLQNTLRQYDQDGSISPKEFQEIRDEADTHANVVAGSATRDTQLQPLVEPLRSFQRLADQLTESLQQLALVARRNKLVADDRHALKQALEHQLAYVLLGYKSSAERL